MEHITEDVFYRLMLSRALFLKGQELCASLDSISFSQGILCLHDSVDLFLNSCMQHAKVGGVKKNTEPSMMVMYQLLEDKIGNGYNGPLLKLNTVRNNIKHNGIQCDPKANNYIGTIRDFLEETSLEIFQVQFSEFVLIGKIKDESLKSALEGAYRLYQKTQYSEAIHILSSIKFDYFDNQFVSDWRLKDTWLDTSGVQIEGIGKVHLPDDAQIKYKLIEFDVDIRGYERLSGLLLRFGLDRQGKKVRLEGAREYAHEYNWTKANTLFCFDFIVDMILKLQNDPNYDLINYIQVYDTIIEAVKDTAISGMGQGFGDMLYRLKKGDKVPVISCNLNGFHYFVSLFGQSNELLQGVVSSDSVKVTYFVPKEYPDLNEQ